MVMVCLLWMSLGASYLVHHEVEWAFYAKKSLDASISMIE